MIENGNVPSLFDKKRQRLRENEHIEYFHIYFLSSNASLSLFDF